MGYTIARTGPVLRWTLDDAGTLNSLSPEALYALAEAIRSADADPEIRCVLITGAGRAFSSGANLSSTGTTTDLLTAVVETYPVLRDSSTPIVAAVNGACAGAGVGLALAADLVIAKRSAYFLLAFVNIGLMPDGGASLLVPASIGRARAMRMALLGERLTAPEGYDLGLVSHLTDDDDFESVVDEVLAKLSAGPPLAYARTKAVVNAATIAELPAALALEADGQKVLLGSADFAEGVTAFRDKRASRFTGD